MTAREDVIVRRTHPDDFGEMIDLCRRVYPNAAPWTVEQLASHLKIFPEGQFVAIHPKTNRVVGMACSLIVLWDDYEMNASWKDFTDRGLFTNHNPKGRTLYGAEVMVDPELQKCGIGKKLYEARRHLAETLGLLRIRAGARLRHYHKYADKMSAKDYVLRVIRGEIGDPTLSFQLKQGFYVLAVVKDYLQRDPASLGWAAVIEWINEKVAESHDYLHRDPFFMNTR